VFRKSTGKSNKAGPWHEAPELLNKLELYSLERQRLHGDLIEMGLV